MNYGEQLLTIQVKYDNLTRLLKEMIDPLHPIYSKSINYMVLTLFFVQIGILLEGFLAEIVGLASSISNDSENKIPSFWISLLNISSEESYIRKTTLNVNLGKKEEKILRLKRLRLLLALEEPMTSDISELLDNIEKKRNNYAHAGGEPAKANWIRLNEADSIQEEVLGGKHFKTQQEEIEQLLKDFDKLRSIMLNGLKNKLAYLKVSNSTFLETQRKS
jgi:hypothetical protein